MQVCQTLSDPNVRNPWKCYDVALGLRSINSALMLLKRLIYLLYYWMKPRAVLSTYYCPKWPILRRIVWIIGFASCLEFHCLYFQIHLVGLNRLVASSLWRLVLVAGKSRWIHIWYWRVLNFPIRANKLIVGTSFELKPHPNFLGGYRLMRKCDIDRSSNIVFES